MTAEPNDMIGENIAEFQSKRAIDIICRGEISFPDLLNFIGACAVFAEEIKKERPDVLFVPLRGASPMGWMARYFLEDTDVMPIVAELPIGSHMYTRIDGGKDILATRGIRPSDKARIVGEVMDNLVDGGIYLPGQSNLMLVDEVQFGSTISDASKYITGEMRKRKDQRELAVFAFRDGRTRDRRLQKYYNIAKDLGVKDLGTTTNTLFTVDSPPLIDGIVNENPDLPPSVSTLRIVENVSARNIFRTLYEAYKDPAKVLDVVKKMRDGNLTDDIQSSILYQEINSALTDTVPVKRGKGVKEKQIFEWWELFARQVIKHKK